MRLLLLEDEYPAAERLRRLLSQVAPGAEVLAVLDSVAGALEWLAAHPAPDLLLSDIQLADGLSFEVFEQTVVGCPVIFTTAYDQYALRAFQTHSVDYLLKPVKLAELQAALRKWRAWPGGPAAPAAAVAPAARLEPLLDALARPARPHKTRFLVRQGESLPPLPAAEVAWFQSRHETTTLATHDGRRFVVDYTLEQLEKLLDPAQFQRLNRQFVAQLGAVRRLQAYFGGKLLVDLHPAPTDEVLVSKERAGLVKSWLEG